MTPEDAIPLDADLIKVLASDSRRDVLKLLKERRMTLSEMARALGLQKATVLEHLNKLQAAGLIQRHDDERKWVYYDLTRQGKRIVNPGRSTFYLVVGVAVLALTVGALVAITFMQSAGQVQDQTAASAPGDVRHGPLAATLTSSDVVASDRVTFSAFVDGADASNLKAFLLTDAQADRLKRGEPGVPGTPLVVSQDESARKQSAAGISAEPTGFEEDRAAPLLTFVAPDLPPGDYFLYLRAATGIDNAANLVAVRVAAVTAQLDPAVWWRGLDGDVNVTIRLDDAAPDGEVRLLPPSGDPAGAFMAPVTNGSAVFTFAALDVAPAGTFEVGFRPEPVADWARVSASFAVHEPHIAFTPGHVLEGRAFTLQLRAPATSVPRDVPVTVAAGDVELATGRLTDTSNIDVPGWSPSELTVTAGRATVGTVTVHPDPTLSLTEQADGSFALRVTGFGGAALRGRDVTVDGLSLGTTDSDGQLTFPAPAAGERALAVANAGRVEAERAFVFSASGVSAPAPLLTVTATVLPDDVPVVEAVVTNDRAAPVAATVVARANGVVVASAPVLAPARGNTTVTLALTAAPSGDYQLMLEANPLVFTPVRGVAAPPESAADQDARATQVDVKAPPPPARGTAGTPVAPTPAVAPVNSDLFEAPSGGGEPAAVPVPSWVLLVALAAAVAVTRTRRKP